MGKIVKYVFMCTEEDGYYEDLYPQAIGGNYSDDLLDVINEDSTDAESTEVWLIYYCPYYRIYFQICFVMLKLQPDMYRNTELPTGFV
jgi:hypothetical protein